MALELTPVAANIKPMPSMTLADMVNVARGAQAYKQGQITLSVEQQKDEERKRKIEFFSRPENFMSNGRIDLDKLNAELPRIAPLTAGEEIQKYSTLAGAQTQAIEAKQRLTQDQRSMIGQRFAILGRLGVQDKEAYLKEMDLLKAENPDNPDLHRLIDAYKITWKDIPSGPQLPSMAIGGANTLLKPETQQQLFAPQAGTASTGAATFQTVTQPSVAGEAPRVTVGQQPLVTAQLGPGAREVPTGQVDVNNNPIVNVFDANGRFLGQRAATETPAGGQLPGMVTPTPTGAPTGAPAGAPPAAAPAPAAAGPVTTPVARLRPGETAQTLQQANDLRTNSRNAAAQVPNQTFNNNEIIKLADEALTGRGAGLLANLTGGYAVFNAVGIGGDNATALNQLGHYMALQTSSLAQSAGLGTDAARNIAAESTGTINWTPEAIRKTARVNRSLATATDLFNQGVQNSFNKTKDPFSSQDFQTRWSQTVDINAVRLFDAMKNNDKEAIREVVTAVGGPNSPGYKRLVDNIGQMQKLIRGQ